MRRVRASMQADEVIGEIKHDRAGHLNVRRV